MSEWVCLHVRLRCEVVFSDLIGYGEEVVWRGESRDGTVRVYTTDGAGPIEAHASDLADILDDSGDHEGRDWYRKGMAILGTINKEA